MPVPTLNFFWFRRDLRLQDNAGLFRALRKTLPVQCLFIFDQEILDELPEKDMRVEFIHREIVRIKEELEAEGSSLMVRYGKPEEIWKELMDEFTIDKVFTNHDYEPYAKERDGEIRKLLNGMGVGMFTFKDQVIFEKDEVVKGDGDPYVVFTPYSKKWKDHLSDFFLKSYPTEKYFSRLRKTDPLPLPSLEDMGFKETGADFPPKTVEVEILENYEDERNFPAKKGTSRISVHLRFGTVSIRKLARKALEHSETWLNELIWREFYMQILWHFPFVVERSFREKYEAVPWRDSEEDFKKWCEGKTGYPLVDAGMRELNETGFMHNRVRMVVASFLTKHLLLDWRQGEGYFAEKLLDYELASNNGGWQWAAGTGTDAAPYFRIFNPASQLKKFDSDLKYVKKWVPEYGTDDYPEPMVEHKMARERALDTYKSALN